MNNILFIYHVFTCSLFSNAVRISDCVTLNDWMTVNNELARMQKEEVMALSEILSWLFPGETGVKSRKTSVKVVGDPSEIPTGQAWI
jgi:hypothetical protein